jgi:uncharacterized Zn finger protein (UPF0148 family)
MQNMKNWRCTVCNYIHQGDQPPEKCPVCGADKSKFEEISQEEAKQVQAKKSSKQIEREQAMVKKAREKNSTGQSGKEASSAGQKTSGRKERAGRIFEFVNRQMIKHHAHPVSVHIPNGVLPVSVLFVILAVLFSGQGLAKAAFYNSVVVLLSMPLVLYTGYNAWQKKYGGGFTTIFVIKIIAALVVAVTCLLVVIWYIVNPGILSGSGGRLAGFVLLNLVMLAAAVVAGLIGGKLVFKR